MKMRLRWKGVIWSVIFSSLCMTSSYGQEEKDPPGIAVGEKAPEFKLEDHHGRERTLEELLSKGDHQFVALVFYRSADW